MNIIIQAIAGEDLTGDEGLVVYSDGSDGEKVKLDAATTDDTPVGILVRGNADDAVVDICIWGLCDAILGAAVEPFDWLMSTTGGKLIPTDATASARSIARYVPPVQRNSTFAPVAADSADTRRGRVFVNFTKDANPSGG